MNAASASKSNDLKASSGTDPFTQQLASALEDYIGSSPLASPNGSHFEIDIKPEQNASAGTRQFVVTVRNSAPAVASTSSPDLISPPVSSLPVTPDVAPKNENDAYWQSQPPEVRQLRDLDGMDRLGKAQELAAKGFLIDVPIMVWGWDPLVTMTVRANSGYTWVPSALMQPILAGPGIDFPGAPKYNPDKPPAGAIMVSTDFAKGLEQTCPWFSALSASA